MQRIVLVIILLLLVPSAAHAQLLLDQAIGSAVGGGTELGAGAHGVASSEMIMERLKQQGYSNIAVSPSGPQQYTATSPDGTPVAITVEPTLGQVISVVPQQ